MTSTKRHEQRVSNTIKTNAARQRVAAEEVRERRYPLPLKYVLLQISSSSLCFVAIFFGSQAACRCETLSIYSFTAFSTLLLATSPLSMHAIFLLISLFSASVFPTD